MRSERVTFGQLHGHLFGKVSVQPSLDIDLGKFFEFGLGCFRQFAGLARKVSVFRVSLRTD